ncbi:MAG: hypothetical protein Tsb002_30200 [Wenzhouxiangellaceae bacterium]
MIRNFKRNILVTAIAVAMAAPLAQAGDHNMNKISTDDGDWVNLSGTITSVEDDEFVLNYGEGSIDVEMGEWAFYDKTRHHLKGEKVTVYGQIDNDWFEKAEIEAKSIYVNGLNTYFYTDEKDRTIAMNSINLPESSSRLELAGTVTSIDDDEFMLKIGNQMIRVDTDNMKYNPLDTEGFQQIRKGDRVLVTGEIEDSLFDSRELMAESIVSLHNDRMNSQS